ncbi:hypothetical protein ACFHW0_20740 [Micromonospora sp. LOL_025]|uniref:hypothetical protein n=1 Tax=Micromonospora sp. LOL_025 TaxID=3345413 RepID=UPI003A8579F9
MTRTLPGHARAALRRAGDPLVPLVLLAAGAFAAAAYGHVLTWAMIGGLAGYTLSGSV